MKNEDALVAGVRLTHPDKILFPGQGLTKRELADYLAAIAGHMLPFASGHPLSLVRCPQGIGGKCFYQKHATGTMPPGFKSTLIRERGGDEAEYLYVDTMAGIVSAAQIGVLELHLWGSTVDDLEHPDRLVFDLDPAEDVGFAEVKTAAGDLRALLDAADLKSFAMVTGGKGIHVIAPLDGQNDWAEVKTFAAGLARSLAESDPERFIATASMAKRRGRIFIDWLRNERGATAIAPYSPRARKGAPVATPVSWTELARLRKASAFDTVAIIKRLKRLKNDPWAHYRTRQHIGKETLKAVA